MNVPENAQTIEVEGRDLKRAIAGAAEQLGLHPAQVDYKLDLTHFRSVTGVSVARETVRILAWKSDRDAPADNGPAPAAEEEVEAEEAKPKRRRTRKKKEEESEEGTDGVAVDDDDAAEDKPKRKRRRSTRKTDDDVDAETDSDKVEADKPEQLRGAESEVTEASKFAQGWFEKLLELMSVEGQVVGTGNDQRVHLAIQAERAGRIVGKRGATLGAIRHLLTLALDRRFGGLTVDVDVDGDRERERERSSKKATPDKPRRERERGGRDRDRDRDDRGDRRGRGGRGGRGGRERPKGKYDEDKLRALARRAAEKAVETGKTFTINLQLNSYDRRVVHLEISEIDGVDSHSEEREVDGQMMKFVQVVPDAD